MRKLEEDIFLLGLTKGLGFGESRKQELSDGEEAYIFLG